MKQLIGDREVIILGSGASIKIKEYVKVIKELSEKRFLISTNFISKMFQEDALFISNDKRIHTVDLELVSTKLMTSNLNLDINNAMIFNYTYLLGEGNDSDNAGAMLIRILKNVGVKKIYLAGFDGFDVDILNNYAVNEFRRAMDYDTVLKKNSDISKQLKIALMGVEYEFITPTKYEI